MAGTNEAIHNLVKVTAQSAVDHYFRDDDNTYLKNFVERVSHGVVNHHLTTLPPLATETYKEPLHPEIFPNPPTNEQNLHPEQDTTTTVCHPAFHNV